MFCILIHLLFESIPQKIIQILNNLEEDHFKSETTNNWKNALVYGSFALGFSNLILSVIHLWGLRELSKEKYSPLGVFRSRTINNKSWKEINVVESTINIESEQRYKNDNKI